jgi:hypothetical protein
LAQQTCATGKIELHDVNGLSDLVAASSILAKRERCPGARCRKPIATAAAFESHNELIWPEKIVCGSGVHDEMAYRS